MRKLAQIISRLFDPIIEVPLILMGVASLAYLNGYRWRFLTLLFFLDAIVPGLMFFWLWAKKKHFKDWDFRHRSERLPLFLTVAVSNGIAVMVAYLIERHPLAEILLSLWLLAIVFTLITVYWKVSIHAGVNATLATVLFWLAGPQYWWTFLVVPAVGWARIVDRDHDWKQVVVGSVLPPLLLTLFFRAFSVIKF